MRLGSLYRTKRRANGRSHRQSCPSARAPLAATASASNSPPRKAAASALTIESSDIQDRGGMAQRVSPGRWEWRA